MKKVNENLYPVGGYYFTESDGTVIRDQSWRKVIRRAKEYRKSAKLPPGDTEAEVWAQACARNPGLCFDDKRPVVQNPGPPLKARVMQWLNKVYTRVQAHERLDFVSNEEAVQRAAICAKCPCNVKLATNSCSTCKVAIAEYRNLILGPKRRRDGRLGSCSVLAKDLPTSTNLDETRVDNPDLPEHCWFRQVK